MNENTYKHPPMQIFAKFLGMSTIMLEAQTCQM